MFCPNCGKQIPDGSKFCPYCGEKIETVENIPEKRSAVRKKNSLLILIPIIVVVIAAGIFLYIKLSQMNDYARRERVKFDFNSIAVALTVYKTDWGVYPIVPNGEEFGKPTDKPIITSAICKELTGTDATLNRPGNTTLAGENGGIEYLKTQTLQAMYNPFIPSKGYHYATDSSGTAWILWVEIDDKDSIYRTDKNSELMQCATSEIPKPNQSSTNNPVKSMSSNTLIGKWQAFSIYDWTGWRDISEANAIYEFSNSGTFSYSSVDGSGSGSYKIIDKNHVQLTESSNTAGDVVEFSISGDELTLGLDPTDPKYVMKLRRTENSPISGSNSDAAERARKSRVAGDFTSLATALEAFKVDWGHYTIVPNGEEFGKPADNPIITSAICKELTGTDATLNRPGNTTLTGEDGGIEYLKTQTLQAMYNPFIPSKGYHYATGSAGTTWILWVEIDDKDSLYRTNKISELMQCATSEIPKPNQSAEKGTKVEAIKAVDINGNAVDLSKLKNFKLFILGINPGCKACVESIQQLGTEIAKYDTSNIKFIVLSFSSEPNDAQKLLLLLPEGAIGILDTDRNLASALKVNSSPYIALVNRGLTLFYRGPGELTKETLDNIKTFLLE